MNQARKDFEYAYSQDAERAMGELELDGFTTIQPKKFAKFEVTSPQEEYMTWSTASLLICCVWGVFAFIASNKVRKYNKMGAYDQAAYYSLQARKYNQSAVACCVILFIILGVPLSIALAVQGDASKFPNAHMFFGK